MTPDQEREGMTSMVEKVARAVYAENGWLRIVADDDDGKGRYREASKTCDRMRYVEWEELDADDKDSRLREARAAIAALREPTEAMWEAGQTQIVERSDSEYLNHRSACYAYQAMIDTCLAEPLSPLLNKEGS